MKRYITENPMIAMITIPIQFLGSDNAVTKVSMVVFKSSVTPLVDLNLSRITDTRTITIASVPHACTSPTSLSPIPIFF